MNLFLTLGIAAVPALLNAQAGVGTITVHVDQPLHPMAKGFYGLMTEEINHAYDGGLYGELVRNRALQDDPARPVFWKALTGGEATLEEAVIAGTALTKSLRIEGSGGVANEGFWGIPVKPSTTYRASLYVKGDGPVTLSIEGMDGKSTFAKATAKATDEWRKVDLTLRTGEVASSMTNRLVIRAEKSIAVADVSLFGPTFKNRPNGNRPDLMNLLGGMKPTFLRLPGGNYLEGNTLADWFDWKKTLGLIGSRPGHQAPWGYRSSDGLGLLEYLEWCEDLKMKPLLAVYAGYALNGTHLEPGPALNGVVQEALDEIEFVTGDRGTKWGSVRAKLGHPKPFPLEYVEIGNEDNFDRSGSYEGRFSQIFDAIKAKHPNLRLIASTAVKSRRPDLVDDHYYRTAAEMARDSNHYRNADRNGPKIFVGEWASLEGQPTPDFQAALGDAAWLTGLERDSDLVEMEAYAPLLSNMNPGASQWNTNLIGYDAIRSFGSPSYYVQAMFAANQGTTVLPVDVATSKPNEAFGFRGGVGVAGSGTAYSQPQVEGRSLPDLTAWSRGGGTEYMAEAQTVTLAGRNPFLYAGDPSWMDLTYTVLARKPAGDRGVGLRFHVLDDRNFWQWNVGGATNEIRHQEVFSNRVVKQGEPKAVVEVGFTTLRLEVRSGHIRGYVDGKLAIEADENPPAIPTVYATASQSGRETILKVVNLSATAAPMRIELPGAKGASFALFGTSMAGPLEGQNSLEEPTKYAPQPLSSIVMKAGDAYTFPAHSITVLHLKER